MPTSSLPVARRARKKIGKRTRAAVYQRDRWTCQDCGQHIPPRQPDEANGLTGDVAYDSEAAGA